MTWRGLDVLKALSNGPKIPLELAQKLGVKLSLISRLCKTLRDNGLLVSSEGVHEISEAGQKALSEGRRLVPGPRSDCAPSRQAGNLRARTWRALSIREKFSLDDLLMLLCDGSEIDARQNISDYLRALESAGYLLPMPQRGAGPKRWYLVNYTGSLAPAWNKGKRRLTDPNTGEIFYVFQGMKKEEPGTDWGPRQARNK